MSGDSTLNGVWDGLYSYSRTAHPESPFTAVLFASGGHLSGTIHETMRFPGGAATDANAFLEGSAGDGRIVFTKTYDGTGGQTHSVAYDGRLSADGGEIDGVWSIRTDWGLATGRFLMVRARRATKATDARIAEKV